MIRGLDKLKKKPRPILVKMAEKLKIKVSVRWNRPTIAKKILEKQKLNELEEPAPQSTPETEGPKRSPEFEDLITESVESEPVLPQDEKDGRGGYREGAGRTPGLTDEKARVQRILKNQVPDPIVKFAFECLFDAWESAVKVKGLALSEDEAVIIAVPTTNLKEYYFPGLNLSPVLEMWLGLAIGVKTIVKSRIDLIREARKSELVTEPVEGDGDGK